MLQRGDPAFTRVISRCNVHVDPSRIKRIAREGHVTLPTDERADSAYGSVHGVQSCAIPSSPDHALGIGGHKLTVSVFDVASSSDDNHSVVERSAAGIGVAFMAPAYYRHALLLGCIAQWREIACRDAD